MAIYLMVTGSKFRATFDAEVLDLGKDLKGKLVKLHNKKVS
jgi:hypothetical protein